MKKFFNPLIIFLIIVFLGYLPPNLIIDFGSLSSIIGLFTGIVGLLLAILTSKDLIYRLYYYFFTKKAYYAHHLLFDFETVFSLSNDELFLLCYLSHEIDSYKKEENHTLLLPPICCTKNSPYYPVLYKLFTKFWLLDGADHKRATIKNIKSKDFVKKYPYLFKDNCRWFYFDMNRNPFKSFLNPTNKLWKLMVPTELKYIFPFPFSNEEINEN